MKRKRVPVSLPVMINEPVRPSVPKNQRVSLPEHPEPNVPEYATYRTLRDVLTGGLDNPPEPGRIGDKHLAGAEVFDQGFNDAFQQGLFNAKRGGAPGTYVPVGKGKGNYR